MTTISWNCFLFTTVLLSSWSWAVPDFRAVIHLTASNDFVGPSAQCNRVGIHISPDRKHLFHRDATFKVVPRSSGTLAPLARQLNSKSSGNSSTAVSNWGGQLGQSPNGTDPTSERLAAKKESVNQDILTSVSSEEVNSLVGSSRSERASRNRLREILPNFESMYKTSQLAKVCELASFWHSVEVGVSHKTIPDVDDDIGDFTPTWRGDTFPRADLKMQSIWSNSRRNSDWTSHRSSRRTTSWQPWTRD